VTVPLREVPCNGCTLCCERWDLVRLMPGDDPALYQTERHPFLEGALMLAHKPNGDCVYLTAAGCSIHDHSPQQCREMDCRNIARGMNHADARRLNVVHVWTRGKLLLSRDR